MKIPSLLTLVILLGLSLPVGAESNAIYPPGPAAYESHGQAATVRRVQLALQARGYYTADNRGNYCSETRTAVRRFQRDNGLPMTNRIDSATLQSLGLL